MPIERVHGVIMAGGGGTRMWPLSRRARPKHLLPLARDGEPLLCEAAARLLPACGPDRLWVVTAADQAEAVRALVPDLPADRVLVEPVGRNTAAAIGLAALYAVRADEDAVLAVTPADQHVRDRAGFSRAIETACRAAAEGRFVTVGIRPTHAATGYGYLETAEPIAPGVLRGVRFHEKPDPDRARAYLAGGRHLWNAGMFFFTARRILGEFARHMPDLAAALSDLGRAIDVGKPDQAAGRIWPGLDPISIDYGVAEKVEDLCVVPGDFGWNDLGSWDALADVRAPDAAGNVVLGDTVPLDASGNVVASDGPTVALVGVRDLIVVASRDAVLVCPRERAQDVRALVDELRRRGRTDLV